MRLPSSASHSPGAMQRPNGHPQPVMAVFSEYPMEPSNTLPDQPPDQLHVRPSTAAQLSSHRIQAGGKREHADGEGASHATRRPASGGAAAPVRPGLQRSKTDHGPRREETGADEERSSTDEEFKIRHGWESQLKSEEYQNLLNSTFFMYFTDKKHETGGSPREETYPLTEWRMKDRLKTVSAMLVLCLNIGVDPPDVIKTNPCAKEECWIDPTNSTAAAGHTPMSEIGKALQTQYEELSMRTRYKLLPDPNMDELRRYCQTLRRNARLERVLFHYNGHGVPRPTASGEIWVFNRNYTQYIPVSLYDIQSWLGAPSLFVYDCSDAGLIIQNFLKFAEKHKAENLEERRRDPHAEVMDFDDCIHLAACAEKETLPTNPDLPADVFTSCLTTPIKMAVKFFILQNPLPMPAGLTSDPEIPGRVSERRTPKGELNWIFTAITDTIAWNMLPKHLFKKLFRQDLMVAALFRNFLLAQRIMRVYHCHPQCYPEIPQTHDHPLWRSWDLAVEMVLAQLPDLEAAKKGGRPYEYQHSTFFSEQLTAFEVYLSEGAMEQRVPEQLPIVLQVLLSQVHRLRALVLLSKFLDLGPWAVNLALSIGIFPYVLKLLQSQAIELKPVMVFIWARILAVDQSCQADLLKDNGYQYFISILSPQSGIPITNQSEHRAMCAFIIAMFCKDYHQGQVVSLSTELVESCLSHLNDFQNPLLRQWSCLCLAKLWVNFPDAKWTGIRCLAHAKLCELSIDPVAEVRAAMLYALTTFLGIPDLTPQVVHVEVSVAAAVLVMATDGNIMVRKELLVFFSTFIHRHQAKFVVAAYEQIMDERHQTFGEDHTPKSSDGLYMKSRSSPTSNDREHRHISNHTVFRAIWQQVLIMSVDPHPEIADCASIVVDYVIAAVLDSPLGQYVEPLLGEIANLSRKTQPSRISTTDLVSQSQPPTPPTPTKQDGYAGVIQRTVSVAASLKNLAFGPSDASSTAPKRSSARAASHDHAHPRKPADWNRPPEEKDASYSPTSSLPPPRVPTPRGYKPRESDQELTIPLQSKFYEWSVEYFREPQMKSHEADEPGSTDYNERLWRRNRNDGIIAETQPQKERAGSTRWDKATGFFSNGSQPTRMTFHQFEDHLVVTDNRSTVCVWDWRRQVRLNRFSNGNPEGSKISEVKFINEDDQALLITGSSDGIIKLFRNYESSEKVGLVTAFRALTDLVPSNKNAGLVFDWQQGRGNILVAGDVKVIRSWNAGTEICTVDIPARSGSCITSLTCDQVEGDIFIAGFGDGAVRVYDQREKPATSMVRVWKEHKQWITNVHLQRGGQRELVSGCRSGEVKLWDIRMDRSVSTIRATKDTLRSLSVHEHAPVFATGTERHTVKIFNLTSNKLLSSFEPYSGFLHQNRSSPIAATAFHPHRMMIAGAALHDTHINIYSCPVQPKKEALWTEE